MTETSVSVSVVIPVHNEEAAIDSTVAAVHEHLGASNHQYEVIVVDDGSTDASRRLLADRTDCRVLHHETNRGYGAALKTGIRHAKFTWIAIVDADGTYPISRLPDLIDRTEHADMVVGSRKHSLFSELWLRSMAKWVLTRFAGILIGNSIPDMNSGMRVFSKHLADRYWHLFPDGFSFTTTITIAMLTDGRSVDFQPIRYMQRLGRSKIRPIADTVNVMRSIVRTTLYFAPGRIIVPVAAATSLLLGTCLAWNAIHVPATTDKIILMLANVIQLGLIFFLSEVVPLRTARS